MTRPASTTVWQYALTAALVLILTSLAMDASCADVKKPAAIYLGLAAADYGSTAYALDHGMSETNPVMRSHALPKQIGAAALLTFADVKLQKSGHPGRARALRIAVAAIRLTAVGLNLHNARKEK